MRLDGKSGCLEGRLRAKAFEAQNRESIIGCNALNRMCELGSLNPTRSWPDTGWLEDKSGLAPIHATTPLTTTLHNSSDTTEHIDYPSRTRAGGEPADRAQRGFWSRLRATRSHKSFANSSAYVDLTVS